MTSCLAFLLLQTMQPTPSQSSATQPAPVRPTDVAATDVVVRARRLQEAHDECLSGRCSPERNAQVSIAMAEQQFRNGDYRNAMSTLAKGIGRTRRFTATHPRPVAALHEAYATVLLHYGDRERYRTAVVNRVRILRDHLPVDDLAVRGASLAIGDMWLALGFLYNAENSYQAEEKRARADGQAADAVNAAVHRIWLMALDNRVANAGRILARLTDDPIAKEAGTQRLLAVLRLKIALRFADDATAERMLRDTPMSILGTAPVLIWAPPYGEEPPPRTGPDTSTFFFDVPGRSALELPSGRGVDWLDVGFWITPSGRVTEVEALRGTAMTSPWKRVVTDQIAGRRYAPFAAGSSIQGVYRLQRFTLRASYALQKGYLARTRSGPVGLQVIDLTASPTLGSPPATAPAASP